MEADGSSVRRSGPSLVPALRRLERWWPDMATPRYVRVEDRVPEGVTPPGRALDAGPLVGAWFATDERATGVMRLMLGQRGDRFYVRAFGAGDPAPYDWGEVPAVTYGAGVTATTAM